MGPVTKTQPLGPHALEPHYAPSPNTWKSIASSSQPETEGPHCTWKISPRDLLQGPPNHECSSVTPGGLDSACLLVLILSSGALLSHNIPQPSRNLKLSLSGLCLLTLPSTGSRLTNHCLCPVPMMIWGPYLPPPWQPQCCLGLFDQLAG